MTTPNFTSQDDYMRMTSMISPIFTSQEEYVRMSNMIDVFLYNKELTLEIFGDKEYTTITETNEKELAEFLREAHNEVELKKRTNFKAIMSCNDEVLFSGLFNFTCFNNFALLLWHSASHANVTLKSKLVFEHIKLNSLEDSTSYKSTYCWE